MLKSPSSCPFFEISLGGDSSYAAGAHIHAGWQVGATGLQLAWSSNSSHIVTAARKEADRLHFERLAAAEEACLTAAPRHCQRKGHTLLHCLSRALERLLWLACTALLVV